MHKYFLDFNLNFCAVPGRELWGSVSFFNPGALQEFTLRAKEMLQTRVYCADTQQIMAQTQVKTQV